MFLIIQNVDGTNFNASNDLTKQTKNLKESIFSIILKSSNIRIMENLEIMVFFDRIVLKREEESKRREDG